MEHDEMGWRGHGLERAWAHMHDYTTMISPWQAGNVAAIFDQWKIVLPAGKHTTKVTSQTNSLILPASKPATKYLLIGKPTTKYLLWHRQAGNRQSGTLSAFRRA